MTIRKADSGDILKIARITTVLRENRRLPVDELSVAVFLDLLLRTPNGIIFVAEEQGELIGAIGGHLEIYAYDRTRTIAREDFRQAIPGAGVTRSLIQAFELWAHEAEAKSILLVEREQYVEQSLEKYFKGLGYESLEKIYIKEAI